MSFQAGDKVLIRYSGRDGINIGTVKEITKAGNVKLTNDMIFNGVTMCERGSGPYHFTHIEPFDAAQWKAELQRRERVSLLRQLDEIKWRNLSTTVLQDVVKIIEKDKLRNEQPVSNHATEGQPSTDVPSPNAAAPNPVDQGTTDQST